jgi:hypothetical protein
MVKGEEAVEMVRKRVVGRVQRRVGDDDALPSRIVSTADIDDTTGYTIDKVSSLGMETVATVIRGMHRIYRRESDGKSFVLCTFAHRNEWVERASIINSGVDALVERLLHMERSGLWDNFPGGRPRKVPSAISCTSAMRTL